MPFSDLASVNQIPLFDIVNQASVAVPETGLFRFEEIYGQSIKEGVITAYAGGGYRNDGSGAALFTLTTTPRVFQTYPMEKIARLDKASNQGVSPEILAKRMQVAVQAQLNSAMVDLATGLWAHGATGPDGLWDMIPAGNIIATAGTTGASSLVWFVSAPAISYGIGNGGVVGVGDITEETVTDDNGVYRAYVQPVTFRATNILRDTRCAVCVAYNSGHDLTLANMYAALAKQNDVVPFTHVFMSRASQAKLRDLIKAEQTAMYTTLPKDFEGLPIVCTPNIAAVTIGS